MALNRCPNGHFYFGGKYRACPACNRKIGKLPDLDATYAADAHTEDARIKERLESIGMLHMANKVFLVNVKLPNGRKLTVHLLGKQSAKDVLQVLREKRILNLSDYYEFKNWPIISPSLDSDGYFSFSYYGPVFACELNPQTVYVIKMEDKEKYVCLYGCPSSKSLSYDGLMNRMTVEVIDYER